MDILQVASASYTMQYYHFGSTALLKIANWHHSLSVVLFVPAASPALWSELRLLPASCSAFAHSSMPVCRKVLYGFRESSATRLARASPRVNRLRRFPRVGRPLRPMLL
eukprot:scaffold2016_cov112-Cylindrotheca_fusiformis.AAC.2